MLRCSEKAFAKCPTRHLCGSIEDAVFTEDSECAAFNRAVEAEPVRHGRWIVKQHSKNPGDYTAYCSNCKTEGSLVWKRCPVCEAKMDWEGNHEA